jgi:predicted helicase
MQGVSINIFVKTGKKKPKELGIINHFDLQGKRDFKYNFLNENILKSIEWNVLDYKIPDYFFIPKDNSVKIVYDKGFSINDIFEKSSSGVQTEFDELVTHSTRIKAETTLNDLLSLPISEFILKYNFQSKEKKIENAKNDVQTQKPFIQEIDYKIFNKQYCIYTGKTNGIMGRPRFEMMKNIISKDNLSICLLRSLIDTTNFSSVFISKNLVDKNLYGFQTSLFPLYIYPNKTNQQNAFETTERVPNLNMEIVNQIATGLGLTFSNEKEETANTFAPIDLLDYIYAVLHSPTYREKYKEFLKIDFPRVPAPLDPGKFWQLVKLGGQLRQIHLLENPIVEKYITGYPEDGDNVVKKPSCKDGNVYINDTQYFSNVPEVAWNFYIGGYQPAQKWLKDRKDRELSYEDILHYQKIIVALSETDRLMKEIDLIEIL